MTQQTLLSIVNESAAQAKAAQMWGLQADGKPANKATAKPASKTASKAKTAADKATSKATSTAINKAKPRTTRKAGEAAASKPTKAVAQAVTLSVRRAKPKSPLFMLSDDARPDSGVKLFAHTHAALTVLGLLDAARPAVPKQVLLTLMGQRAVTYHTKQGNLESGKPVEDKQTVRLSLLGYNKFSDRAKSGQVDAALANAYMDLFVDGTVTAAVAKAGNVYQSAFSL